MMNHPPLTQRFVLHFGTKRSLWGISRTAGQIYALLYASVQPINAEGISKMLTDSRSNVSIGLKELQSWHLVRQIHQANDLREYFQTPKDVWAICRTLVNKRRKREINLTLSMLRKALMEQPCDTEDIHAPKRMRQMHDFIEQMTNWWLDGVQKINAVTLASLIRMGSKIQRFLEMKEPVKQIFIRTLPIADTTPSDLNAGDLRLSSRFSHYISSIPNTEADHG